MPRDVLINLQQFSWKGIELPYTEYNLGFSHESAERKFIFRDQALIQRLGRSNQTFRYSIPFYDGLRGFGNLFTDAFDDFYNSCLSRDPGMLVDPLRGNVRAVCASLQVNIAPDKARDGAGIELELIESPRKIQNISSEQSNTRAKETAANESIAAVSLPPDPEFQRPLVNPINFVTGLINQVALQRDKVSSQIQRETARVDSFTSAVNNTSDPNKWRAREALLDYKQSLIRANRAVLSGGVRITTGTVQAPVAIAVLARDLGMSLGDFQSLNPELTTPFVPDGTEFNYYEKEEN